MVNALGGAYTGAAAQYDPSAASRNPAAAGDQRSEEVTTVTTHCNKQHKHTPACPHTTTTRPADSIDGKGNHLDVFA